jgi:hypothetical protein
MAGSKAGFRPIGTSLRLLGVAAVLGSLLALAMPLSLGAVDRAGTPITCGTGYSADIGTAQRVDQLNLSQHSLGGPSFITTDYVGECAALIADRRWVAITVLALGAVIVLGTVIDPLAAGAARAQRKRGRPDWVTAGTTPITLDDSLSTA